MKIYWPFKQYLISQRWGNPSPDYLQFGFSQHNGIDAFCIYRDGTTPDTWPLYCPVEGFVVQQVRWNPNGGGNEIWLISKDKLQIDDKLCLVQIIFMHNDRVLVPPGYEPKLGELISIADNTGFSTGPHSHMGMYRVNTALVKLDTNEANGSYNPEPFFANEYAVDKATLGTLITSNMRYYKYLIGL